MKKLIKYIFLIGLISCDNEIPIDENFVVEAFLFQGEKVDDIRVKETKLWNSEDSIDTYIENANVKLFGNGNEFVLSYNSVEETYFTDDEIEIISGNTYGLEVTVGDRTAAAETIVPTKPIGIRMTDDRIVVPPLVLSPALPNILANLFQNARTNVLWDNQSEEYHYLTIKYDGEDEDPIFSEEIPGQVGEFFSNFSLQSAPTKGNQYNVICMSLKNYGKYKVTLYKINKDYYSLFENQVQDGTDLNEPPSNVVNAFGIFSAFASDTTSFEIVRN
ncbi:MAG: DUF4249 family protein [Bacteroidota bacterium]|nr:DUF4249 family protein [Bacteroidota bacterium]